MSDYNELCRMISSKLPIAIQEIKHECKLKGKFCIVGSIPIELTEERPTMFNPTHRESKIWDTENEVVKALLAIGKTSFQLSDCSWYEV